MTTRQPAGVRRTTVRLCPDLLARLTDIARQKRITRAHLIDRLLRRGVGDHQSEEKMR